MKTTARPIFQKPAGESKRSWNNLHIGTTRDVICELCGTRHPRREPEDESYTLGRFMGMQFVEGCCGNVIDGVYYEFGEEFAMAFLEDFAEDPTSPRFAFLRFRLPEIFASARAKLAEADGAIAKAQKALKG